MKNKKFKQAVNGMVVSPKGTPLGMHGFMMAPMEAGIIGWELGMRGASFESVCAKMKYTKTEVELYRQIFVEGREGSAVLAEMGLPNPYPIHRTIIGWSMGAKKCSIDAVCTETEYPRDLTELYRKVYKKLGLIH